MTKAKLLAANHCAYLNSSVLSIQALQKKQGFFFFCVITLDFFIFCDIIELLALASEHFRSRNLASFAEFSVSKIEFKN